MARASAGQRQGRTALHAEPLSLSIDGPRPVVVVVMLTGTKTVNGPVASGIAGAVYKKLAEQAWFVASAAHPKEKDGMPALVTSYPRQQ